MTLLNLLFMFFMAAHAEDYEKIEIKATPLRDSVYMLEGAGGNITALTGPDGTFLVDDDFAPMAAKLVAKLKELKGDSPRFIVNTHFHYDHTGGNEVFGRTATIISAPAVRERLATEQILWHESHPAEPPQALPTVTVDKELRLHLNGETIRVLHLPSGHTDGDSVVFFAKARVYALGDLYFSGMYPIFHPEHNGSLKGYLRDVRAVLRQLPEDALIVPGHGPLAHKQELKRYANMIEATINMVGRAKSKGLTLEQIQQAGLPSEWEDFSHGYLTTAQWLKLVFNSSP